MIVRVYLVRRTILLGATWRIGKCDTFLVGVNDHFLDVGLGQRATQAGHKCAAQLVGENRDPDQRSAAGIGND